ncbi:MAG TPA: peptidylprolyl isomerase [Spirochaetota bacterium]|nr:peptidylprolyl isomerase [Spirochaetota bacterium]HPC39437.1 peptidylprolyl isomerase [Spirochaetota bacterium]HPL15899.1 peptidylprolyl isomerase [Spirochaetota bacterium]HQF06774.1 peptidylprolyl isomerase [Spirochaetota bacterium]HQH95607.1 peptidylprolyl isomerase [Spirochaetota bacterium]
MKTTLGDIHIELFDRSSPKTVRNFLQYTDKKFYNGTMFHRVIPNFIIQGGGFTPDMTEKDTESPMMNESNNGVRNMRGTIAMARTHDIHSATSQFFINITDNHGLDYGSKGYGYCVFGRVVKGMDVVDKIRQVRTQTIGMYRDVPVEPVVIISVQRE